MVATTGSTPACSVVAGEASCPLAGRSTLLGPATDISAGCRLISFGTVAPTASVRAINLLGALGSAAPPIELACSGWTKSQFVDAPTAVAGIWYDRKVTPPAIEKAITVRADP